MLSAVSTWMGNLINTVSKILVGKFVSFYTATSDDFTHIKSLKIIKYISLKNRRKIIIPNSLLQELVTEKCWIRSSYKTQSVLERGIFRCFTDWLVYLLYVFKYHKLHINFLKIKAPFYGLKSLAKKNNFLHITEVDNQTAMSCINRCGIIK